MNENSLFSKSPKGLFDTLLEQARIRLQYGPEFIGDLEKIEVGLTPRHCVYQEASQSLYHYPAQQKTKNKPILLVYSLINRPYIFDLRPGRSLIEFLCQQGYDVYLLDWGDPTPEMGVASLGDFVTGTLDRCVRKVLRLHQIKKLTLLGYCMGASFAALYAGYHPERIERMILLAPILGHDPSGQLQKISAHQTLPADAMTAQRVSGRQLKMFFNAIKPAGMIKKERDFWKNYDQQQFLEHFLPVEKWSNDTPDIPGRAFHELLELLIKQDALKQGRVTLDGKTIQMDAITCPVMAVAAKHDWIIPASTLETCREVLSAADYTPYLLNGGHIGLVVGRSAAGLWQDLLRFLDGEAIVSPLEPETV